MNRIKTLLLLLLLIGGKALAQPFESYKLNNGLTVYLWSDENQSNITGTVAVRVGSIDEPAEYTGLAHYLEHLLFKGTQKIGSLDWEKEKPHYENIIRLYDEYSSTTDQAQRADLEKKINEESLLAAEYAHTSEFSNLIEGMGGEGLNAGTSYDMTFYYNSFPSYQVEKWLDLYSERLIDPVFRSFQAELENVFEEYNMYQDNNMTHVQEFLFNNLYKGHPYERPIIGTPDHLKNPRLSKLIEFYDTWYVPSNMALILVGNFKSEEVKPLIEAKFGRLIDKPIPDRGTYPETSFSNKKNVSAKIGYTPMVIWGYKTVGVGHEDEFALDFFSELLSNSMNTGLLDKINLDGDVQMSAAMLDSRRDRGRFLIQAVPYYDSNQRRYHSNRATEKVIMQQVEKLLSGDIDDWLMNSVRNSKLRQHELLHESSSAKTSILRTLFTYNLEDDYFTKMPDKIKSITKDEVVKTAQKYLSEDHILISIEPGSPKKDKLNKPDIKPIEQPKGKSSEYAEYLKNIPITAVSEKYNDLSDVKKVNLYDKVSLHYTENPHNEYFTLTLKYGIGKHKSPKLAYAVDLMNSAGIMPDKDAQSVRREFSELNATCNYAVTDDYLYISLIGLESNLEEICRLMTMQVLMPKLDETQLNQAIGREISTRIMLENQSIDILSDALLKYALYDNESDYIDRPTLEQIYYMNIGDLTGEFIRGTDYEIDIHYVGKRDLEDVKEALKGNLPLKEGVKPSTSPEIPERVKYKDNTILFLQNKDAQQARVYFYVDGFEYNIEDDVNIDAFNQYFGGGFNGLVMNEIRENNSLAYTSYGLVSTPPIQNKKTFFMGYVGTQPDKVADAVDLYMKLITDMPKHPERIDNIKTYLKQTALSNKPAFRSKSQVFSSWQKLGYNEDPAKVNMDKINNLTFDDITNFYESKIKGKPVVIVIMGDQKLINLDKIRGNHGKVTRVNSNRLFSKN